MGSHRRTALDQVNRLLAHDTYKSYLQDLKSLESERVYCKHDLQHFLDVARIATIINLKEDYKLNEEDVYLAALLHDVGKTQSYKDASVKHSIASAVLAKPLLQELKIDSKRIEGILYAIEKHNSKDEILEPLAKVIAKADHLSRQCHACMAYDTCKWPETKKNHGITY